MSKKVLIVDDDPVVRILVSECLLAKGFEVCVAEGGTECFKSLARENFDVVVLDFFMPEMSGIEVSKRMREDPTLANLPILMLSADPESKKLLDEYNVRPDAFLEKPIGLEQITKAVKEISGDQS